MSGRITKVREYEGQSAKGTCPVFLLIDLYLHFLGQTIALYLICEYLMHCDTLYFRHKIGIAVLLF